MRIPRLIAAITASAVLSGSAAAAPPAHPELNPLFAAEWWLRGHTTMVDESGQPRPSDGVDAIAAWPGSTGEGVVVAVADSGVDPSTPSLRTQLLPGRNFLTGKPPVGDPLGHGTHVAALIAGNPTQGDGIFGVAPEAQILPLRVATARGRVPVHAAAAALAYAAHQPRVRVVNMSWRKDFTPVLERALAAATNSDRVLLVSAAGNDARDLAASRELPQTFDNASELTVASTDILDHLSWYSNYGAHVEVAAPGERILSAYPGDTLKIDDGTSMAAPLVSGVAALLFSRHPEATPAQVKAAIVASCTPVPELVGRVRCGGIVNASNALTALATMFESELTSAPMRRLHLESASPSADRPSLLNNVARFYSIGVGELRCPSQDDWDADPHRTTFSWGYTNVRHDYTVLPPLICTGALNVGANSIPAWQQAAGVWMLVHEAFHLRHWRQRRNEAKVGCQTIVYFTDAAARLGATETQARELYPYALALYALELRLYPWHRDPKCIVPPWLPPTAP
jgi:hypothetical protein